MQGEVKLVDRSIESGGGFLRRACLFVLGKEPNPSVVLRLASDTGGGVACLFSHSPCLPCTQGERRLPAVPGGCLPSLAFGFCRQPPDDLFLVICGRISAPKWASSRTELEFKVMCHLVVVGGLAVL